MRRNGLCILLSVFFLSIFCFNASALYMPYRGAGFELDLENFTTLADQGITGNNAEWGVRVGSEGRLALIGKHSQTITVGDKTWTDYVLEMELKAYEKNPAAGQPAYRAGLQPMVRVDGSKSMRYTINNTGVEMKALGVSGNPTISKTGSGAYVLNGSPMKFKVDCRGGIYKTYINDELISTVENDLFAAGGVGFTSWIAGSDQKNVDLEIYSFKVSPVAGCDITLTDRSGNDIPLDKPLPPNQELTLSARFDKINIDNPLMIYMLHAGNRMIDYDISPLSFGNDQEKTVKIDVKTPDSEDIFFKMYLWDGFSKMKAMIDIRFFW